MKTIIETTYKVKVAHGQGTQPLVDTGSLNTVRRFLNKKSKPFDFDVEVFNWDGDDYEMMTYTGDDFMAITNPNKERLNTL